jgi:hypothetical protein
MQEIEDQDYGLQPQGDVIKVTNPDVTMEGPND